MPTRDPEKNRANFARHRAMMKANEETKKEYDKLNASYFAKHAAKKKKNWELRNIIRKKLHICGNTELDKNKHSNK